MKTKEVHATEDDKIGVSITNRILKQLLKRSGVFLATVFNACMRSTWYFHQNCINYRMSRMLVRQHILPSNNLYDSRLYYTQVASYLAQYLYLHRRRLEFRQQHLIDMRRWCKFHLSVWSDKMKLTGSITHSITFIFTNCLQIKCLCTKNRYQK